jgi:hypothetical protein
MDRPLGESLIARAMAHWKITPADAAEAGREPDLEHAQNRCRSCAIAERCEAGLSRRFGRHVPADCPNGALFAEVANHRKVLMASRTQDPACSRAVEAELMAGSLYRAERFYVSY